jgi:hypothetical protein
MTPKAALFRQIDALGRMLDDHWTESDAAEAEWEPVWRLACATMAAIADGRSAQLSQFLMALKATGASIPIEPIMTARNHTDLFEQRGGFAVASPPIELDAMLSAEALAALFDGRTNLVHVHGYVSPGYARDIGRLLCQLPTTVWTYGDGTDKVMTDVFTIGTPAQTATDYRSQARYFSQDFEIVRRVCQERLSPLDKLRLDLDALYANGATVRDRSDGMRRLAGIVRLYLPDDARQLATDGLAAAPRGDDGYLHIDCIQGQEQQMFTSNIYLDMPDAGGELVLYNMPPIVVAAESYLQSYWELLRNFPVYSVLIDSLSQLNTVAGHVRRAIERRLPAPLVLRPEPGDLILFNPGAPHSVRDLPQGCRVSIQSFLMLVPGQPVRLVA